MKIEVTKDLFFIGLFCFFGFVFVYVFSFTICILSIVTKFIFQEQYKTIFLVLHEICKAQINPKTPTDFLKCLETGAQDKPVNSSALRKEFQVRFVINVFCEMVYLNLFFIINYFSFLKQISNWNVGDVQKNCTSAYQGFLLFYVVYNHLYIIIHYKSSFFADTQLLIHAICTCHEQIFQLK